MVDLLVHLLENRNPKSCKYMKDKTGSTIQFNLNIPPTSMSFDLPKFTALCKLKLQYF